MALTKLLRRENILLAEHFRGLFSDQILVPGDLPLHECQHLTVDVFGRDVAFEAGIVDDVHGLTTNPSHAYRVIVFVNNQSRKKRSGHSQHPFEWGVDQAHAALRSSRRDYPAIGLSMTTTIVPSFSLAVMDANGTVGFDQRYTHWASCGERLTQPWLRGRPKLLCQ